MLAEMEMLMKKIIFIFALWVAKFTLLLGKILKKQGSMISGKVAVAIQKDFVRYFSNIDLLFYLINRDFV